MPKYSLLSTIIRFRIINGIVVIEKRGQRQREGGRERERERRRLLLF